MFEPTREPNLTAFETALASLSPAPVNINRDGLLFRAGQASVRRRWLWPATSGTLAMVAASLAIALVWRPTPEPMREVQFVRVEVPVERQAQASSSLARLPRDHTGSAAPMRWEVNEYRAAQDQLLRWGLDAVPSPHRLAADQPAVLTDPLLRRGNIEEPSSAWPWFRSLFDSGERL